MDKLPSQNDRINQFNLDLRSAFGSLNIVDDGNLNQHLDQRNMFTLDRIPSSNFTQADELRRLRAEIQYYRNHLDQLTESMILLQKKHDILQKEYELLLEKTKSHQIQSGQFDLTNKTTPFEVGSKWSIHANGPSPLQKSAVISPVLAIPESPVEKEIRKTAVSKAHNPKKAQTEIQQIQIESSKNVCVHFLKGNCRHKKECKYSHEVGNCIYCGEALPSSKINASAHLKRCYQNRNSQSN
jgi:hypothetical protein